MHLFRVFKCCDNLKGPELGTFGIFEFFNNKKRFFKYIFYKINNLFLHQFYFKSPFLVKFTW